MGRSTNPAAKTQVSRVYWEEDGQERSALWRSENGSPPPKRVRPVDDRLSAAAAYRLACEGTALLWRGDYHGARQLLAALGRRVDRKPVRSGVSPRESFHLQRQAQSRRARVLGMLVVPLTADYTVPLRRAPALGAACAAAYGPPQPDGGELSLVALRELLGVVGAYEWQRRGVSVPALGDERVYSRYGVFAPVRGEYVDLVAAAELPATDLAYDVGAGTGVLGAVLARRGVRRVVATETEPRALVCARDNVARLGVADRVQVEQADLFPGCAANGRASLVVCNPPWLPAKPTSPLERAVYDPGSRMLRRFLGGLAQQLTAHGEGWLVLSDLAERLELRTRAELLSWIADSGLGVVDRIAARPRHRRATDADDPLYAARSAEVTSLWRLRVAAD